jgi:hypothetical protein
MDDLKVINLKEEAPYRTLWSTRFGKGHWLRLGWGGGGKYPSNIFFSLTDYMMMVFHSLRPLLIFSVLRT